VKPENILRFRDGKTTTGVLQIADFGLAKQHRGLTVERGPTVTRHSTLQYESPEAELAMRGIGSLSRLSDIWSMGCVMLEYLIWLIYGDAKLDELCNELKGNIHGDTMAPFYERTVGGKTVLRPAIVRWIEHMKNDPECRNTALGDILWFTQEHLLVTDGNRAGWGKNDRELNGATDLSPGMRATAKELWFRLNRIIATTVKPGTGESYLFQGVDMKEGKPRQAKGPDEASSTFGSKTTTNSPRTATPPVHDSLSPNAALFRPIARSTSARNFPSMPMSIREVRGLIMKLRS